jgi:hypothetical protein
MPDDNSDVCLNNEGMTLDSLYHIVNNPRISYQKKMAAFYTCNHKRNSQQEKQTAVINALLSESKKRKDANGTLYGYIYLADLNNEWENECLFNTYIDSADLYADHATNPLALAGYHYTKGTQAINAPYGQKEGYKQFEKAIDYYRQTTHDIRHLSYILYNIAIYTANQPDSTFSKRLIEKVEDILQKERTPFADFSLNAMKSDLYSIYFNTNHQERMLDSAIFYEQKRIDLFYVNADNLPEELHFDILQSYLLIAKYCSMKKNPDWPYINACIEKAKRIEFDNDAYITSRIKYTEALSFFEQKNYAEAESRIAEAEHFLTKQIGEGNAMYPPEAFYSDEATFANLHGKILYATGRYEDAFDYNRKKNSLKFKMRNIETRELEYLYNTEKEERKIERLKAINANRVEATAQLILFVVLLVIAIVLLCVWFYTVNKSIRRRSILLKTEKEETELNLKIQEQQAVQTELEKYEVLADYRLKEMELEGKNKTMEQLIRDKDELDRQIDAYSRKINEFEQSNIKKQEQFMNEEPFTNIIIDDIIKLITKKIPKKHEYSGRIKNINGHFVSVIKNSYNGNLSVPYIKYCICFAIGMEIGDVSECFSIEQSSVHMVRYRLKKKFGLDNNDDLDVFLRRLSNAHAPETLKLFD